MTGRDLIIYILQNNLEDKDVFENGVFVGFMTEEEAAAKFKVGVPTIRVWHSLGFINGISIGNNLYILRDTVDPRNKEK
jgi:hypothetical protein